MSRKRKKKKKQAKPVCNREKKKIVLVANPAKRKMPREEFKIFLRESSRGCGAHGVVPGKTKRRKDKQNLKGGRYDNLYTNQPKNMVGFFCAMICSFEFGHISICKCA